MSFKTVAFEILKYAKEPLHIKEIVKRAKQKRMLETAGETPELSMSSMFLMDMKKNGDKSWFYKTGKSIYGLRPKYENKSLNEVLRTEKKIKIRGGIHTKEKGDIAESKIAEMITLYGKTALSCYKPVSDVEGIDLIVKKRDAPSHDAAYLQIKSNFRPNPSSFTASVKDGPELKNKRLAIVFCFFDVSKGDFADCMWFVPAKDLKRKTRKNKSGHYVFCSGFDKKNNRALMWSEYITDKFNLGDEIADFIKKTR